ncbi:methylenetetrahydrofolate reductase isoform X2 [Zootermopsis nevadensis]|uniref:methylenetetrahydrofolate reductase isoform X2 n=1 Tax=Zootermopsis nevadensis TaxID=136037 RepID=UPI000B8E536E|nr:methylenetetrahydrofolate reductase isoform X2 [Zootermopsis nevadensis]
MKSEPKYSLAEQMYARIDSGDNICSFEISPPKSEFGTRQLLRSLQDVYSSCNPLFTAITWHLQLTADVSLPSRLLLGEPQALRLAAVIGKTNSVLLHLSSVGLTKRQVVCVLRCARNIGTRNVFALRGDRQEKNNGLKLESDFSYAVDLVSFIQEKFGDYFTICVAGYPLGHPDAVSFEQDLVHLKEKVDVGASFIITQFFFQVDVFINFVQRCRRIGIRVPIIPGVMLIRDYTSLIHTSNICSVKVPREVLDIIEPIKDNEEAVRKFGVHLAVEMVSYLFRHNYSYGAHFFTLNRQSSIIEACKCLGFCSPEPARPLRHQETNNTPQSFKVIL